MAAIISELQSTPKLWFKLKDKLSVVLIRQLRTIAGEKKLIDDITPLMHPAKKGVIIECKRPEFNHYTGQIYDKFKPIPLASKGWHHKKSKGDHFIINKMTKDVDVKSERITFEETGLDYRINSALTKFGFSQPTEVQERGIPSILLGCNTALAAETGCGKTLAYLLPIMQHILKWKKHMEPPPMNCPLALILSPNRELAQQIHDVIQMFSEDLQLTSKVIIGGHTKRMILNPEFSDVDILVGTLGAISKLTTLRIYKMSFVRHVVLDEADTLLDDSFNEKLSYLLRFFAFNYKTNHSSGFFPSGSQLTLASATMPRGATETLQSFIATESLVSIKTKHLHHVLSTVKQHFIRLSATQRPQELLKLVKYSRDKPTIIFSTKTETSQWVSLFLNENGIDCLNLNGEMTPEARAGKFAKFQKGLTNVISCTDIGSRGLNTTQVKHVINFEFPMYVADYIHRCGRTGRLGSSSDCRVTNFIVGAREVELVQKIELSIRSRTELPNVNGNIKRLIVNRR
ncbi:hypothetical protein J437_LFUL004070 [Ladona fulva]|uniref:RNA helicase n=1 Tax=Ladona fulva TaxID=123851 RepID=A0A8K0JVZ8_LADFU|nr:hypothetical protein J437_LFUL004070 [Ladona fulva]